MINSHTSTSPLQVCNSIYFKTYSSDNPFPALGGIFDGKMKFGMYIQPFLTDEELTTKEEKGKLYDLTENWFEISRKLEAIELVISKVILNGYPKELENISTSEIEEKERESKLGRPYDSSAPQEKIREKVKELAKVKRYKNDDGTPKPTAIRDEILNKHPELYGDVSESTVFRRVKRAIETLGIS